MVRERESYFHFLKGYQKNLKKTLSIDKVVKNKNNFNVHVQIHQTFTFTVHSRSTHGKKILVYVTLTQKSQEQEKCLLFLELKIIIKLY